MGKASTIVWFRNDLRLDDQPALQWAITRGGPVLPVFIWSPNEEGDWLPGGATRWWLHQSLKRLDASLRQCGSKLILRRGPALQTLRSLIKDCEASAVAWNRRYEAASVARDKDIKAALRADGTTVESFNGSLLFEPWTVQTGGATPFKVFTPFWRKCQALDSPDEPEKAPSGWTAPAKWPASLKLDELALEPRIRWDEGLRSAWEPGEEGAVKLLERFLPEGLPAYSDERDRPDHEGTSRLSPFLHFGEISPRRVWYSVKRATQHHRGRSTDSIAEPYLRQLAWREFAHHLLYHFPKTAEQPLRPEFSQFPWESDASALHAWQQGRTGFPYIDAGMRQLWHTGWMHNRVRMAVASFLVKDLLIPWQEGARWFWDTLVDADLANNTLGWQWTSGCGADAAPYFRIFNPVEQGKRFDPEGTYIRRWVPELGRLSGEWLHEPWRADRSTLKSAGVDLGVNYPRPIVDHADARRRALEALAAMKRKSGP